MEQNKMNFDEITILKNTRAKKSNAHLTSSQHEYIQAFGELLDRYSWDWACTLTFNYPCSKPYMKRSFWEWKKRICKDEHMQIGYCMVLCENSHSHLHALLLGANRFGRTLAEVDRVKWKREWVRKHGKNLISMKANKVENVGSAYAYGAYMANNARYNDFDIELSSPRFLRKFSMKP